MSFPTPVLHTTRRGAQREAERMPVNGFGVLVQARGGERWAIYRDTPWMYRAQLCGEAVAHFGETASAVLTMIGLFDGPR